MECCVWGCSLKNHGVEQEVEDMFDMGAEVMDLPLEEKMKFEEGDGEMAFGSDILSILPSHSQSYYNTNILILHQKDTKPLELSQWMNSTPETPSSS